jgi:predicted 3-demethylubiquinone-9 3-methyltransferase (glyoxalase superfamily)
MQKITSCLWFSDNAVEAVNFYLGVFGNGTLKNITHYDKASAEVSGRPEGSVLTVSFELFGQEFLAMNGGPIFKFTPAISFIVNCDTQEEVDKYWNALAEGGDPSAQQCGWLMDKFGLSWQIVPKALEAMISDPDKEKSARVMSAMLKMKKIELPVLERAFHGDK